MFALSPSRSVKATVTVMAVVGVVLVPDELGRAFGFPILAGAAAMAYGGRQLLLEAAAHGGGPRGPETHNAPAHPQLGS